MKKLTASERIELLSDWLGAWREAAEPFIALDQLCSTPVFDGTTRWRFDEGGIGIEEVGQLPEHDEDASLFRVWSDYQDITTLVAQLADLHQNEDGTVAICSGRGHFYNVIELAQFLIDIHSEAALAFLDRRAFRRSASSQDEKGLVRFERALLDIAAKEGSGRIALRVL